MKVRIDIDCTPVEARAFFGLPDVGPLQEMMLKQMQDKIEKGLQPEDMEQLMKLWMSGAGAGLEQMQKLFWQQLGGGNPSS